jgi:hypothetical protein
MMIAGIVLSELTSPVVLHPARLGGTLTYTMRTNGQCETDVRRWRQGD